MNPRKKPNNHQSVYAKSFYLTSSDISGGETEMSDFTKFVRFASFRYQEERLDTPCSNFVKQNSDKKRKKLEKALFKK